MVFIFQQATAAILGQEFLINCPYPIYSGIAANVTVSQVTGVTTYSLITGVVNQTDHGTYFACNVDSHNNLNLGTVNKPYSLTLFNTIPYGWFAWVGDTISIGVEKIGSWLTLVYLYLAAPSQVTGLAWFAYVQIFLLVLIAIGIFMVMRG